MNAPTRIAITMGDPNGVGPEVALKSVSLFDEAIIGVAGAAERDVDLVLVGVPEVFRFYAASLSLEREFEHAEIIAIPESSGVAPPRPRPGSTSADAGRLSMAAVEVAVDMCLSGEVDAMVTAPISKESIRLGGYDVPGHTEFIAHRCRASGLMIMVAGSLRVALITGHIPISEVSQRITESLIIHKAGLLVDSLMQDFGCADPRIAVLGLNPHAGDGGVLGMEERERFEPALAALRRRGIHAIGPYPADAFFARAGYERVDGVLAAYHDQGLVPFKTLAAGRGVNFTAGLPIVRTSPDHGTAFDIAGRGVADAQSTVAAIRAAQDIVACRQAHAAASA